MATVALDQSQQRQRPARQRPVDREAGAQRRWTVEDPR